MPHLSDYSIIPCGRAWAVTHIARGIVLDEIPSYGEARDHIGDFEDADRIEAEEEAAAVAEYEAAHFAEAA